MAGDGVSKNVNCAWRWKDLNILTRLWGFRDADGRTIGDTASDMTNTLLNGKEGGRDEDIRGLKPTI
jgi:hypothetical protein